VCRTLVLLATILVGCASPLPSDHEYSGQYDKANAAVGLERHIIDYRGCSGVVIASKGGKSYVATAGHCVNRAVLRNWIKYEGASHQILRIWCDKERDICFLEVDGTMPPVKRLLKDKPNNRIDTTIGFVDGQITRLAGQAIPGQSGGGIFTEDGSIWGTVSTTGTGVSIYPALERLGLLWVLK
jgi:hypothetical protein